jgi:hypothetical protein
MPVEVINTLSSIGIFFAGLGILFVGFGTLWYCTLYSKTKK